MRLSCLVWSEARGPATARDCATAGQNCHHLLVSLTCCVWPAILFPSTMWKSTESLLSPVASLREDGTLLDLLYEMDTFQKSMDKLLRTWTLRFEVDEENIFNTATASMRQHRIVRIAITFNILILVRLFLSGCLWKEECFENLHPSTFYTFVYVLPGFALLLGLSSIRHKKLLHRTSLASAASATIHGALLFIERGGRGANEQEIRATKETLAPSCKARACPRSLLALH